jgi:hypothetical protein
MFRVVQGLFKAGIFSVFLNLTSRLQRWMFRVVQGSSRRVFSAARLYNKDAEVDV